MQPIQNNSSSLDRLSTAFPIHYVRIKRLPAPPFRVSFYPYARLNHTIRERNGVVLVKLSDMLNEAPFPVLEAILLILMHRLYRLPIPREATRAYHQYVRRPELRQLVRETGRKRGRKRLTSPQGKVFNLESLLQQVNEEYFDGKVKVQAISWSHARNKRSLGHYDPTHDVIIVNQRLDNPLVPEFVVKYIVYHELLHAALGEEQSEGRRRIHHARFRKAEKQFSQYRRAQAFLRAHFV